MNQLLKIVLEKTLSSKTENKTLAILVVYGMFLICALAII